MYSKYTSSSPPSWLFSLFSSFLAGWRTNSFVTLCFGSTFSGLLLVICAFYYSFGFGGSILLLSFYFCFGSSFDCFISGFRIEAVDFYLAGFREGLPSRAILSKSSSSNNSLSSETTFRINGSAYIAFWLAAWGTYFVASFSVSSCLSYLGRDLWGNGGFVLANRKDMLFCSLEGWGCFFNSFVCT